MTDRHYTRTGDSWYSHTLSKMDYDDEIIVGYDGGDEYVEFGFREREPGVRLEMYSTPMRYIGAFSELFSQLDKLEIEPTLDVIEDILQNLGYENRSEENMPESTSRQILRMELERLYPDPVILNSTDNEVEVRTKHWPSKTFEVNNDLLEILRKYPDTWGTHPAGDEEIREAVAEYCVEETPSGNTEQSIGWEQASCPTCTEVKEEEWEDTTPTDDIQFKVVTRDGETVEFVEGYDQTEDVFDKYQREVRLIPDPAHERRCLNCGEPQFLTYHGWVCSNGHGGNRGINRDREVLRGRHGRPFRELAEEQMEKLDWLQDIGDWFH